MSAWLGIVGGSDRRAVFPGESELVSDPYQGALVDCGTVIPSHWCCENRRLAAGRGAIRRVAPTPGAAAGRRPPQVEGQTRAAGGPAATRRGPDHRLRHRHRLGLSAAGVRRHLDALIESGRGPGQHARRRGSSRAEAVPPSSSSSPPSGRGRLGHAYDDLAGAAMRQLREVGGDAAIKDFARRRVDAIVARYRTGWREHTPRAIADKAVEIADAFSAAGFAATTRRGRRRCADLPTPLPGIPCGRGVSRTVRGRTRGVPRVARHPCAAAGDHRQR